MKLSVELQMWAKLIAIFLILFVAIYINVENHSTFPNVLVPFIPVFVSMATFAYDEFKTIKLTKAKNAWLQVNDLNQNILHILFENNRKDKFYQHSTTNKWHYVSTGAEVIGATDLHAIEMALERFYLVGKRQKITQFSIQRNIITVNNIKIELPKNFANIKCRASESRLLIGNFFLWSFDWDLGYFIPENLLTSIVYRNKIIGKIIE